jgi:hypothetical protein
MEKDRVACTVTFILTVAFKRLAITNREGKFRWVGVVEHSAIVSVCCWIRSVLQTDVFQFLREI